MARRPSRPESLGTATFWATEAARAVDTPRHTVVLTSVVPSFVNHKPRTLILAPTPL
jgi:hypothetical protein